MSRRRNLELLEYHLESAAEIMDKENLTYTIGIWFKFYIGPTTFMGMRAWVHNIRERLI
jgi:hypothetical protein